MDRHVPGLYFRAQKRGAEHDGHALSGHAVFLAVVDHPGGKKERLTVSKKKIVNKVTGLDSGPTPGCGQSWDYHNTQIILWVFLDYINTEDANKDKIFYQI